jgi:integrase
MFRHGVRDLGALPRNPVRDLDRGDRPSGKRQSEPRYLSVEEVEALLARMSDQSRPVTAVLFYAALRVSEALTLTWADIDFDAATIQVHGTKTKASAAAVPLLRRLAAELRAHRARQATLGFERVKPEARVFATRSGRSPSRRNVLRAVQNAATAAGLNAEGLPPVGLQDLRHSLAASAFALGLTAPEVARLLRHASTQVTLSVYSGISDKAASALGTKLATLGECS